MDFWKVLWTVIFFASLAFFAGLAIVVSIGGFFNIRSLFKTLSAEHKTRKINDKIEST